MFSKDYMDELLKRLHFDKQIRYLVLGKIRTILLAESAIKTAVIERFEAGIQGTNNGRDK